MHPLSASFLAELSNQARTMHPFTGVSLELQAIQFQCTMTDVAVIEYEFKYCLPK